MKFKKLLDNPDDFGSPAEVGFLMHDLAAELWPLPRSITGAGLRDTLAILQREIPELTIHSIASGTECFDWTVPEEWSITEAFLRTSPDTAL